MRQDMTGTRWRLQADSLAELVQWVHATPVVSLDVDGHAHQASCADWDLNAGYAGALRLARDGWPEGVKQLHSASARVQAVATGKKISYGIAGERPDIVRFLGGDPNCMIAHRKREVRKPIITLCVGITASGVASATAIWNYGAALLHYIDMLENSGRRVEVLAGYMTCAIRQTQHRASVTWLVKAADQPLDMASLAFSIAHPAASRRLGFACAARRPKRLPDGSGTGNANYIPVVEDIIDHSGFALVLAGAGTKFRECDTPENALRCVAGEINRAAGETLVELED